ncbi:MAG: methylenetetrahydrofolate reductase [Sulfuricurvum sp.]|uniref:methylenetetrahydrofolate reductase n=1 Tax=Sulfuricurvum sp. TaxID=2025608 RepID=UPI0025E5A05A|nr:methylenetetrahydrofolate reductase [Sulfuricurvum sp.]MCK9373481.1 methylenetetrahydrofolate reductase [Sulfuricurvum sp.]
MFELFLEKLRHGTYITLETTPSRSAQFAPTIDKIEALGLQNLVDGFSTTDNPLAKLKYNALFAAMKLQERFGKPALATMSMRDRNRIALQSDLLGANEANVRAILALTGDSAHNSDQPHAKGVFEGNSKLLLDIIATLNNGTDMAEQKLIAPVQEIYPFAVTDAYAKSAATLQKKMTKKVAHGAIGIISQPVYDLENAKKLLEMMAEANLENSAESVLVLGYFPITKLRTARFLDENVPGIFVPSAWVAALEKASHISPEEEYKVGFELSKTLFEELKALHPKIHIMTANQFELAKAILS